MDKVIYLQIKLLTIIIDKLPFDLIDFYDRDSVKSEFKYIEQWNFIEHMPSPDNIWLQDIHKKLKKVLKKKSNEKI